MLLEQLIKTNVLQIYIGYQHSSKGLWWPSKSMGAGLQINAAGHLCRRDEITFEY